MTTLKLHRLTLACLTTLTLAGLSASAAASPPVNDYFINATPIDPNALPFGETVNIFEATTEFGESEPCAFSQQTIWYKITPTTGVWLRVDAVGGSFTGNLNVYRDMGSGIFGLNFLGCSGFGSFTFRAGPDSTPTTTSFYLQAMAPCCGVSGTLRVNVVQIQPPAPIVQINYYPSDPSKFDTIQFFDSSYDPGQQGIQLRSWDFGDGATATVYNPAHAYGADGDYTVTLTVTTVDGRTGSASQNVSVKTHDVAITKFRVPQNGAVGHTGQITVGIRNTQYPENVRVELYKGVAGSYQGFEQIGYLQGFVPVRTNRTTDYDFSYTFTNDDARIGKVTFKAVATLTNGRDALPADNEAIATTRIGKAITQITFPETPLIVPETLALLGVTPNPARGSADLAIRLALPVDGAATLQVIDIAGRVMAERHLESLGPGVHEERLGWDRRPAPGIYWVRLTQLDETTATRLVVLN